MITVVTWVVYSNGSPSNRARSASLPFSSEPTRSARPRIRAASIVTVASACSSDKQEYAKKEEKAEEGKGPARDLRLETLVRVLQGELPLLITAHRAHDILSALRLAKEFAPTVRAKLI